MKNLALLSLLILGMAACGSTPESTEDAQQTATETAQQAENKATEASKSADGAKSEMNAVASKAMCTLNKDTRVIEVKKTDAGGCELFYTKFGEAKSVASSGFGTQYCDEVKDRIQSNLDKAGFKCQ